ncbi:hypothetical protein YC2023_108542 [Brassica napus]
MTHILGSQHIGALTHLHTEQSRSQTQHACPWARPTSRDKPWRVGHSTTRELGIAQSISMWRCCPRLVQFHRSVKVLLDTPPKCPKKCPAAKGDSVQISLSRRVSFFMMKPRLCPSQDQSSPVKSSMGFWPSPLRSTSCVSHRTLVLGHIGRTTGTIGLCCRVECLVRIWNISLRLGSRLSLCCVSGADSMCACLGLISVSSASYPAGSRKPLICWIGKTQTNGVMYYG